MSVFVAALLLVGVQAGVGEAAEAKKPADEKVCRRDKQTGSRIGAKRVCRTRAEWRELDEASSRSLENSRTMTRPTG